LLPVKTLLEEILSEFSVRVVRIAEPVVDHPDADRLSLVKINGFVCVTNKLEDGSHRYNVGDLVVYVPEGTIVPEYLLRQGFWNEEKGHGFLAGSNHDRVKIVRLRGVYSQGILFPVEIETIANGGAEISIPFVRDAEQRLFTVEEGAEVSSILGLTKYEPAIPASMAGITFYQSNGPVKFDFESIQNVPDLFTIGELVDVTEKVHGTHASIGYIAGNRNDHGFCGGEIYVNSKGLGAKGLVFKDVPENDGNVYVRALRGLLASGYHEKVKALSASLGGQSIRIFGEIAGAGVQDLGYGLKEPTLIAFDVKVGDVFLQPAQARELAAKLGIGFVPSLTVCLYDLDLLVKYRDGKDTISGTHVREGIVIRSMTAADHDLHGRKIGKWVSPAYLLRKGDATEFQ
jgi:RNA ligase (TIGR02306 family)